MSLPAYAVPAVASGAGQGADGLIEPGGRERGTRLRVSHSAKDKKKVYTWLVKFT